MITIVPIYQAHSWVLPVDLRQLKRFLAMFRSQVCNHGYFVDKVELYLIDDGSIAKCNQTFLCCSGPTNILSFPGDAILPGTLLLSIDTYRRECKMFAQDPFHYLLFLLAHGFAHLAGFNHGPEMEALQKQIFDFIYNKEPRK